VAGSGHTSPSERADRNERAAALAAALDALPPDQRDAVLRKHLRGQSLADIAADTGAPRPRSPGCSAAGWPGCANSSAATGMTEAEDDEIDRLAAEFLAAAERGAARTGRVARPPSAHAPELAAFLADLGLFAPLLGLPALPADPDLTADLTRRTPRRHRQPGERFDVFELTELLGSGGMGEVHRAARVGTSLVVALKRLRPGLPPAEAQRFREEAEALLGLDHEHIVKVYHVGESDGRPYFTMRLAEGGSLDRHAGRFAADPRAAARLMVQWRGRSTTRTSGRWSTAT
jgi:hypothetical protein